MSELPVTFREREVGLLRREGFTLKEVGRVFKVTKERARQIEKKYMEKLGARTIRSAERLSALREGIPRFLLGD